MEHIMKQRYSFLTTPIFLVIIFCITAVVFFCGTATSTAAGGASLFGRVIGPSGVDTPGMKSSPVEGAAVDLQGPDGLFKTTSDKKGGFMFNGIPPGDYILHISKAGYETFTQKVTLKKAEIRNMERVKLEPEAGGISSSQVIPPDTAFVAFAMDSQKADPVKTDMKYLQQLRWGEFKELKNKDDYYDHFMSPYFNFLMLIDPENPNDVRYVELPAEPAEICFNISGTVLYVADNAGKVHIFSVLNSFEYVGAIPLPAPATDMKLGADGKFLYVSHLWGLAKIDTASQSRTANLEINALSDGTPAAPMAVCIDKNSVYLSLAAMEGGEILQIDDSTLQEISRALTGKNPTGISMDSSLGRIISANHNSADISLFSSNPMKLLGRESIGVGPSRTIVLPGTANACITCTGENKVSIVSLNDGRKTGYIKTGKDPQAIAASSDGARVYAANRGDGTVSIIDGKKKQILKMTRPQALSIPVSVRVKP